MGLPREVYNSILQDVDVPVLSCLHIGLLERKYPGVSVDAICAIFAQENQYKVLKTHHIHKAALDTYCRRYLDGEDLLSLCGSIDFPPCLLMRRMLEALAGLSKQRVSDVLKQPELLQSVDAAAALQLWQQRITAQQQAQHQLQQQPQQHQQSQQPQQQQQQQRSGSSNNLVPTKQRRHPQQDPGSSHRQGQAGLHRLTPVNTTSNDNATTNSGEATSSGSGSGGSSRWQPQVLLQCLQRDVVRCVLADRSYSPYCDMAKSAAGLEYEAFLYQRLTAAGVPFWTEQELRERGLFKTPDALLQVPVCLRGCDGGWHMVHWLDSKASFGDDRTHTQQMEGQYATYVNRYGPGCVIYWFGFIADLWGACVVRGGQGAEAGSGGSSSSTSGPEQQQQADGLQQVDVVLRDSFPTAEEILMLPH